MNWNPFARTSRLKQPRVHVAGRRHRLQVEELEDRCCPAVDVLTYHNDIASTGENLNETQLTPANVQVGSFGKLFTVTLDGQVYAQPLVKTGLIVTGQTQAKDVVFVATEHDSLYAIDDATGAILWTRTFLDATNPNNNTLGATTITTVPYTDVTSTDIMPEIGITGTPVIDASTNTLYVVPKTKEIIGGNAYYVQRLHAINLLDGTDRVAPYLIGATTNGNTNTTQIYSYGSGVGSVVDPYNGTGKSVVQFNALREHQRGALSLVNGTVYVEWASHGDTGPYHGWVAAWDVSALATKGMVLKGVFDSSPNGSEAGIWQAGGRLVFEADGSAFYFDTGNGGGGHTTVLDANGFPVDGAYYEALVKLVADSTTTPQNQNLNGWGFKVADYFIPYNQPALDNADSDFGSGGPLLLPDSAGIPGHPHLLLAAGKQGKIYVIDRDNMGRYNPNNDNVLNAVPDGSGHNTPPVVLGGSLSTPVYFNGKIYWISGYNAPAEAFTINTNGTLSIASQTAIPLGNLPGTPSVSANGALNGIIWTTDRNLNVIHAYDAGSFSTELWNSGQKAGGADNLGAVVKFAVPTVANGEVIVGTTNSLVVYGLTPPAGSVPNAPTGLTAAALSGSSINLSWTDTTTAPNTAGGYKIFESTDNVNFTQVTTAPAGVRSIAVGGLTPLQTYYFYIKGYNGVGDSPASTVASATTTNLVASLDFSSGFTGSNTKLSYNGAAAIFNNRAEITSGSNQTSSVFAISPVDITKFNTQFTFQMPATANSADGITFTIQGNGPTAIGSGGGGLGYGPPAAGGTAGILNSVAVKFDLYNNQGEGPDSTGLYLNGVAPTNAGSIDLTPSGVDLHSGDIMQATMAYDGTTLTVTLTDTVTGKSATQSYVVNISQVIGTTSAYVGFTGSTGYFASVQDVLTWIFSPNAPQAPATPTSFGGQAASATSVALVWTNTATNQTGFHLDRATDAGFTQNLITQTLPATPNSFTDTVTGLAPGNTFYYRLRAFNSAGDSANSNTVTVSIPVAPNKPTGAMVTNVTTSEIDLSWTDNAGLTATGYHILRAVNHGVFTTYATLPALNGTPPSLYSWSDTGVTPGNFYEYHVIAYNISGYNDFSGTNATSLTLAPTGVTAVAGNNLVTLSWTAPTGAVTYNIYRGTTSGGESATPVATGIATTSYSDATALNGISYYYVVTAVNSNTTITPVIPSESARSSEVVATPSAMTQPPPPALNFSAGFAGSTSALQYNGNATINGAKAELTNGSNQTSSVFSLSALDITKFTTQFTFKLPATNNSADGFTFAIQGVGPTALGSGGGGLGYGPSATNLVAPSIGKSVAVKFDLYNNQGEGPDSTGLFVNGAAPTNIGSIDLTPSGVNLHSGDTMQVNMSYDGTTLTVTILDLVTNKTATQSYAINIPQTVGGNTAYVGFTAGTGYFASVQDVLTWTYTPSVVQATMPPAAPTGLAGAAASASTVALSWNASSGQTGYHLDRASDINFTQNLLTQTLPAAPNSFTDAAAGLAAGTTVYYRLRAFNSSGDSTNSTAIAVTIPTVPASPTSASVTNVTTSQVALQWTDNAGSTATGYQIMRAVNHGAFAAYASLPPLASAGTYSWTDTSVVAGSFYDYQISAYNIAGSSGIAETTVTAITLAPTGLGATAGNATVNLAWTAPAGAASYNIYRGTTAGAEATTPIAKNILTPSYSDTGLTNGVTYYYKVTAVNANTAILPVIASESAASTEVSATPVAVVVPALNFSQGFAGSAPTLQYNGSAAINGAKAELTSKSNSIGTVFSAAPVNVAKFNTQFTFQFPAGNNIADGLVFVIQGVGSTAVGSNGGGIGYGAPYASGPPGIGKSVAIKFDTYNNQGEGPNSTGLYLNGAAPTNVGAIDLTSSGVNLHSGDIMQVNMTYDGTTLSVIIKDTLTGKSSTQTYTVNITQIVGGSTAYVGFTAATGYFATAQDVLSWTFTPTP